MIKSFHDKDLEKFWLSKGTVHVKCVPSELRKAAYGKLMLNRAATLQDLRIFPSNHLEKLQDKKQLGFHSIRINIRYRLIFAWKNNDVWEIEINKHDKNY